MQVKKFIALMIILTAAGLSSCSSKLPETPKECFNEVKSAYDKKDAKRLMILFSKGTIESYKSSAKEISAMSDKQREALFTKGIIPKNEGISAVDLLRHELEAAHTENDNPVYTALSKTILSIGQNDKVAGIRTMDGVELRFVKEGSYWKFSPEGK